MKLPVIPPFYTHPRFKKYAGTLRSVLETLAYAVSLLFILALIYEYGFTLPENEIALLETIFSATWAVHLARVTLRLFEAGKQNKRERIVTRVLAALLYLSLIPLFFIEPHTGEPREIWLLLHNSTYRNVLLIILSIVQLSYGAIRLLNRQTNPSLFLATSFLAIIFVGTGLLMLPRATTDGIHWVDALFMATSSVCVTGLTPIELSSVFTGEGYFFIALLIQIGGLGVMTLTSFFALFFMGNISSYNQRTVREMISSKSKESLLSTLLYILLFTVVIEMVGMVFLFISIHDTMAMTLGEEVSFVAFHAISGFCNAGFSILPEGMSNPELLKTHRLFYFTLTLLIITGSIGFPILSNFRKIAMQRELKPGLYNLNTKIVLTATLVLLLLGVLVIGTLEWNHAFKEMTTGDKLLHSFFSSASWRTAGFNSVDMGTLSMQTILLVAFLMIIGGGAQSTAGGIKVNAFATIVINLWAVARGRNKPEAFGRELTVSSVLRANATLIAFLMLLFVAVFLMTFLEPHIPLSALVFECTSALSTAGSTLNTTHLLGTPAKLLIILLMFTGRVGIMTLLLGMLGQKNTPDHQYPQEEIIIN